MKREGLNFRNSSIKLIKREINMLNMRNKRYK